MAYRYPRAGDGLGGSEDTVMVSWQLRASARWSGHWQEKVVRKTG